jgi:hypothetical protein
MNHGKKPFAAFLFRWLLCAGVLLLALPTLVAQETTGDIEAYVKDVSGAAVPKATVVATGPSLLVPRTLTSDDAGYVHFAQLPPGEYSLSVTADGFKAYKIGSIMLAVGKQPRFDVALEVGTISTSIEVMAQSSQVDVATSNVTTAIPQDVIDNLPKGRSFQSLIPMAPGARQEPLQSSRVDRMRADGFQIDGASDSENNYLVEGLDTSNIQNGGIKENVIFDFVNEVQVKTSGTEAEYGGAMGGVVNVVLKSGGNNFHGALVSYFKSSALDANDQCATTPQTIVSESVVPSGQQLKCGQRYDPNTSFSAASRLDQATNYYVQKQDNYKTIEAGYEAGGKLITDKLWFFSSYIPDIDRTARTINFTTATNGGPRTFYRSYTAHNMMNRLDYQPFGKLKMFGAWQYGYAKIAGQLPALPDSLTGQANPSASTDPTQYRSDTGSTNPSNLFIFGGDYTPNSHVVATARYGYFYYNSEDRGKPTGIRDVYLKDLTTAVTTSPILTSPTFLLPTGSSQASFGHATGFQNLTPNLQTLHDVFWRKMLSTDLSYFVSKWGTHNLKFGYGNQHVYNDVFQGINSALVNVFDGVSYSPSTSTGKANCATIEAQNASTYGAGNVTGVCAGYAGYFTIMDGITTVGIASSYNHAIYGQDSWTMAHGLTVNYGIRFDKEHLPPYSPGNPQIDFGFTQKVSPRIGLAYDLLHNGKLKVFADYGKYYDIMKYSLPRGSFGGEYWHDCVYAMDSVDYTTITPTSPGGHACGPTQVPAAGVTVGRFIENINWRAPAGNPADPGVDPNIKPMSQHEYIVGTDWSINPKLSLEVRYARKRLDEAIDDMSVDDSTYYIGNPGPNTYANLLHRTLPGAGTTGFPVLCATCPNAPKAIRNYDGLETRLVFRQPRFYGALNYTFSRLYGNYSGLTDTDVTDGNGGRHNANNNRSFDLPEMQYTTSGKVVDGPLATDRPNVVTGAGYYILHWHQMETNFGLIQTIAEGSPRSTCVPVIDSTSSCQYWGQRGEWAQLSRDNATGNIVLNGVNTGARMPVYSQTDLNVAHSFGVSKTNEAMKLTFEMNVENLFNQHADLADNPNPFAQANEWLAFSAPVTPANPVGTNFQQALTGYDPVALANSAKLTLDSQYGRPILYQNARTLRLSARFNF